MGVFLRELKRLEQDTQNRTWIFIPYDQLSCRIGPLSREDPGTLGIIIVENLWKASLRPYHKQKLAYIMSNMRHFALEQAHRGIAVRHLITEEPYHKALKPLVKELGRIRVMRPAERELFKDLEILEKSGGIEFIPNETWLTKGEQLRQVKEGPPWRMDAFYRKVRRDSGILMEKGRPIGGKFSFDRENRRPWKGTPRPPEPPLFPINPVKAEVGRIIEKDFSRHPGNLRLEGIPSTLEDSMALWSWAKSWCLPYFGTYEDAMTTESTGLFHTRLSSILNLSRITPLKLVSEAMDLDIEINSKEGFIRQILGWREFVRHVHYFTDGFRDIPHENTQIDGRQGNGGYKAWSGRSWKPINSTYDTGAGASPNLLNSKGRIPPLFWGNTSGLACIDRTVSEVWQDAYGHHITRLMILSNFATLIDVLPRELADWFWIAYSDAFDWVVEPNVLGMGTFSTGEIMTTKPYVSGAVYINRMSDFCRTCPFDPSANCPFTSLYWAFLERKKPLLKDNIRMKIALSSLSRRKRARRIKDRMVFEKVSDILSQGGTLSPERLN